MTAAANISFILFKSALPSISTPDSIDWKEPTPEEIKNRILEKTKSGSILLFHNDLANTTEALPQILTELKSRGFEFVPVSELIYKDNYTIDANGEQSQTVQSSLDINEISEMSDEEIRAVIAQNADKLAAAGFTEEQALAAAAALKNSEDIPEEVQAVISQFADALPVSAGDSDSSSDTAYGDKTSADTSDKEANTSEDSTENQPESETESTAYPPLNSEESTPDTSASEK